MVAKRVTCAGWMIGLLVWALGATGQEQPQPAVRFNTNFEGGSLGRVVVVGPTEFRCHVAGQYDERGRNRQATWYSFRMDGVAGRELTITMTDFVGEYNDRPGAVAMSPGIVPVYSEDGKAWRHFEDAAAVWDGEKKELTLKVKGAGESVWIAHVPPYTWADLKALLADVERSPVARVEVIGQSGAGRAMQMVTVTDFAVPDDGKKVVWLQARQHAWEAGTSYVMEGALRFIVSEDPAAAELRKRVVFRFTPMVDVDGVVKGNVRFNANGYDVNRHWGKVDLRDKAWLARCPEIWYTKRAITTAGRIDLMVNLHNTETGEYVATQATGDVLERMRRFEEGLVARTSFDPSRRMPAAGGATAGIDDTNTLFRSHGVPVMLMEQRISAGKKLGRRPTVEDRRAFGKQLVVEMAGAVSGG